VKNFGNSAKKLNSQDNKLKKLKSQLDQRDAEINDLKQLIKSAKKEKLSPKKKPNQKRPPKKVVEWKKKYEEAKKKQQEGTLLRSKNYEAALFEQLKLEQKAAEYMAKNEQMKKEIENIKRAIEVQKLKKKIGPDLDPE
jgi:hypothetical protein